MTSKTEAGSVETNPEIETLDKRIEKNLQAAVLNTILIMAMAALVLFNTILLTTGRSDEVGLTIFSLVGSFIACVLLAISTVEATFRHVELVAEKTAEELKGFLDSN